MKETRSDIAAELVAANPSLPARTLARMLKRDHPKLFTSVERARSEVRRVLGVNGVFHRKTLKGHQQLRRAPRKAGEWDGIPIGEREIDWTPHNIRARRVLVLADIHAPYHFRDALVKALEVGRAEGCDHLFLNGDALDCYAISRWETDPRKRDFKKELDVAKTMLRTFSDAYPGAVTWKMGNHEERYTAYMLRNAPVFLDVPQFQFRSVTGADELGIQLVEDMRVVRLGKLNMLHGHEYRFSITNPVNPARGLFLRSKVNAACGHFHQSSQHSESDLNGKTVACWSSGCLCDLHPRYMPLNKWNHGFLIVDIEPGGAFSVRNFRILDGKVYG